MKKFCGILFVAALSIGVVANAEDRPVSKTAKKDAQKAAKGGSITIPKDAVEVEPFLYRYTDTQGKVWMYKQGPFGITKWEEAKTPVAPVPQAQAPEVRVEDLGSSYRFERATPFGTSRWVHAKSDLTDEEKEFVKAAEKK